MSIAYYNGCFSNIDDVRIPLFDRAVYFGDGIYDAAIGMNGKIYMETEHIERFFANAEKMDILLPLQKSKLRELLRKCVELACEKCFFLYFQATRKSSERKHTYPDGVEANLLITVTDTPIPNPNKAIRLSFFEDKRYSYCNIKTLNLLPSVLASKDAQRRGFDEGIFLRDGIVTECAHSNIAIIKDGELFTHPECCRILPGTARKKMLETALDMGIVCHDIPFSRDFLLSADEVLVTSSTKLCIQACEVEGQHFKSGGGTLGEKICLSMFGDFQQFTK